MKRSVLSMLLIPIILFVYNGWFDVSTPQTVSELNNDLDKHALAYEVIDDTPLILASFGGSLFLDTLQLERISMNVPPYPQWQWTGNWDLVDDPMALATVEMNSEFGPTVLFGLLNDDSITTIQVEHNGEMVAEHTVDGAGYIVSAEGVLLTDTILFLDSDGNVLARKRPID